MPFAVLNNTNDPFSNLALEEKLCAFARDKNTPVLFLWQNRLCCVIGVNQNPWLECNTDEMERCGALLVRRKTGGGAVCHDLGNLNFSFCFPEGQYEPELGNGVILSALNSLGIRAEVSGRNDLCISNRKFSGSAFRHSEGFSLHHGTLLVNSELSVFDDLLTPDTEKLRAKGVRSVGARVMNLCECLSSLTVSTLKTAILSAFSDKFGETTKIQASIDVSDLAAEYADPAFRFGKTPTFSENISLRFPSGSVTVGLSVEKGVVSDCHVWSDSLDTEFPQKLRTELVGKTYFPELVHICAQKLA